MAHETRNRQTPASSTQPADVSKISATRPHPARNAVCLCADARMMIPAMFVAHSLRSTVQQGSKPFDIIIFCEPSEVTDLQRDWMKTNGIDLRTEVDMSAFRSMFDAANRLSPATLIRLFLPALVKGEYDRILYLDSDLTIHGDIARIFTLDLGYHAFAAVRAGVVFEKGEGQRLEAERHFAELGMTKPYRYFNSGVLLIDIERWIERKITDNALEFVRTSPDKCRLMDEDALNATIDGNFCAISPIWNMPSQKRPGQLASSQGCPVIIHHMGFNKPWRPFVRGRHLSTSLHYFGLYRSFLAGTPWEGWLSAQWSLKDLTKYLEWEVANAFRSISRRGQRAAFAEAVRRYRQAETYADVVQGLAVREGCLLRLSESG